MSSTWHQIHEHLLRSSSTLGFQREFQLLQKGNPLLGRFTDPAGLLDLLHTGSEGPDDKNLLLKCLVEAAQGDGPGPDCALTMLLLALWPGLDALHRRARWRRLGELDDLTSDILARATEAIRRLDLQRVNRIAATILRNIQRDLVRDCAKNAERAALRAETDPDQLPASNYGGTPERLYSEVHRLIGADAGLVFSVAVHGFTQREAAVQLGMSEAAARKRYQRATRRLQDLLHEHA